MVKTTKKIISDRLWIFETQLLSHLTMISPLHLKLSIRVAKGLEVSNIEGIVVKPTTNYCQEELNIDIMWKYFTTLL
jgi:hypothetical protein